MTPLVPSSLGRGTSLRTLPKLAEWGVSEVASCRDVVVKAAAARKGISAEAGLTINCDEDSALATLSHFIYCYACFTRERACVVWLLGKFDAPRRAIEAADRVAGNIAAVKGDVNRSFE